MKPAARVFWIAAGAAGVLLLAWAGTFSVHGQDEKKGPPSDVDVLTSSPFDRVTLIDGSTHLVEPLNPRPLPPIDPSKAKKKRAKNAKEELPPEGNIGLPGQKSTVKTPADDAEDEAAELVELHMLAGEIRDFRVKRSSIKSVDYFEDMLLAESDRYRLARDFSRSFECCLKVQARNSSWRGLDDRVNQLLFAEGSAALLNGDTERGLRHLRELSSRRPDFPGLADKLAASYSGRAGRAYELGLFALGRRILHDAEPLAPNHPLLKATRARYVDRATELARSAAAKAGSDRLDALTDALRVWPTLEGADAQYRQAFAGEPTLEVAVVDVPAAVGPWLRSPADRRIARLLYRPILARDDEEAMKGSGDEQLAAEVASGDLGRSIVVQLRPGIPWSDGSRAVSASDVARALTDGAEPTSPRFVARWADLLEHVDAPDESHVEIRLTRATLRPGAWLVGPVGPAHGGSDGRVAGADRSRELVVDGPYRLAASTADRLVLRLGKDAPGSVRRIKEVRYPNINATLGALARGEVALVEHVPPERVAALKADPDVRVGRYARPRMHRIAIDGRNPALRNRSLRRGLSYAVDRATLLEETLLRRPPDDANRPSDGPFPRGNYADAPDVKPLAYDPLLARMLIAGARKELGGQPIRLNFEYPALAEAQAVAPKLAEAFRVAGVEINLVEKPESELEAELRSGRRFDLAYRVSSVDEPVVDTGPLIAPAYDAVSSTDPLTSLASPRILQLLLELERAPEWPTAKGIVVQIDRECRDELPILPLWELEDHYAWRTRLKGPGDAADSLYDGIAAWQIEPWFARDPW